MAVVDIIIKIDSEGCLKEVSCIGECKEWFKEYDWNEAVGQKIDYVFGKSIKSQNGIVEIQNKFLKYQLVDELDGGTIYLSRDGVLLELYKQSIRHVAEGIQIYDRNGYFLHSNPASEALEHYKNESFKGKHILDLYDLKEEYSTILTVLRTQKPVVNRCDRFKVRNGKTLTTINSAYPLKIDNSLYGAVVFESDLSVLKQIKNRIFNLESYVESRHPKRQEPLFTFGDIIHTSESMKETIQFAKKVSLTDSSVLIVGDTGTGKELMAQSIHSFSPRRYKPFIDVNCGAVPSNLFESMFFGTEKGAFTGSVSKKGFFEMADGGTIFLDEVNSISLEMQAKLLRVLQEKRFQRIGGSKYIKCDVRIIVAANENLLELMQKKKIRKDFYYRISAIKINVPLLQERKEDIPVLTRHFLNELCNQYGRQQMVIEEKALGTLIGSDWPGNVRELKHVVEYAFNHACEHSTVLRYDDLPDYIKSSNSVKHKIPQYNENTTPQRTDSRTFEGLIERFAREIICETLNLNDGNITKSAKILGMSRQSLQYRLRKLGISTE